MTELCDIATNHGTDKAPWHWGYTKTYFEWLEPRRAAVKRVLEIGVLRGQSLRLWRDYFPNAIVYGVDNNPDCMINEERIKSFCCDAYDASAMAQALSEVGDINFVVDDALHDREHQIAAVNIIWPNLLSGGLYAIEESQDGDLGELAAAFLRPRIISRMEIWHSRDGFSLIVAQKR